jgi:hypothetical protein
MSLQRIYVDYDFNKNKILNARLHPVTTTEKNNLTSQYNSNDKGIIVYDTDEDTFYSWNGNTWVPLGLSNQQLENIAAAYDESIENISVTADANNVNVILTKRNSNTITASVKIRHTHQQTTASNTWLITHNLNSHPNVTVVDTANTEVVGDIVYIDLNTVRISFTEPFSGSAYFN